MPVDTTDVVRATDLCNELSLPQAPVNINPATCTDFDALLLVSGSRLSLQQTARLDSGPGAGGRGRRGGRPGPGAALPGPVSADFGNDNMRHRRRSGHNELLGRAVGVTGKRHPNVLDATAGLGRDSFVLAGMACSVTMCEREPIIAALLASAMETARASSESWLCETVQRMQLHPQDARNIHLQELAATDVIYLDPMFPGRDKSAAVKKEMALLQAILKPDEAADADALLSWALAQDAARVVVKRPARAAALAGMKPSHSVTGKSVRFDVHVLRALP